MKERKPTKAAEPVLSAHGWLRIPVSWELSREPGSVTYLSLGGQSPWSREPPTPLTGSHMENLNKGTKSGQKWGTRATKPLNACWMPLETEMQI